MKALDLAVIPDDEEVLTAVTKKDPFDDRGELRLEGVLEYLRENGLHKSSALLRGQPKALVEGLIGGGVVIEVAPAADKTRSHAKLLAGIRIKDGNISLREYDPDTKEPENRLISLDQHVEEFYGSEGLSSLSLIVRE